jgi:hypothetical protein
MRRFIVIDHWLSDVGGHNYQYAVDLLAAAAGAGYQPVLATHRQMRWPDAPADWTWRPLFAAGRSKRDWLGSDGSCRRALAPDGTPLIERSPHRLVPRYGWPRSWPSVGARRRGRKIAQFADSCRELFRELGWRRDDIVFYPSVSEFDLLGIVRFLNTCPQSRDLNWHLQFHFDIFAGSDHQHPGQQARLQRFRQQFAAALRLVPEHRLHLYCTTEAVAEQYNRMGVATFQWLPYPTSGQFVRPADRPAGGPLRVTCAGVVRREKGRVTLYRLLRGSWEALFASGQLQLIVQTDRKGLNRIAPRRLARRWKIVPGPDPTCSAPVVPVAFPLSRQAYAELIGQAQVGLFLYEPDRYFARCSGVLVEMLAAGVPVIVPARCWLADQIHRPTYEYLERLAHSPHVVRRHQVDPVRWRADGDGWVLDEDVPEGAGDLAARLWWEPASVPYAAVRITQHDRSGCRLGRPRSAVLGNRCDRLPAALVAIDQRATRVCLRVENACDGRWLQVSHAELAWLDRGAQRRSRSSVGLVALDGEQIPELLEELLRHYEHYRVSAEAFARQWRERHAPERTIEILQRNQLQAASGAAA